LTPHPKQEKGAHSPPMICGISTRTKRGGVVWAGRGGPGGTNQAAGAGTGGAHNHVQPAGGLAVGLEAIGPGEGRLTPGRVASEAGGAKVGTRRGAGARSGVTPPYVSRRGGAVRGWGGGVSSR